MMMKAALDVIEKQREFRDVAAEEFAQAFQEQTLKISEAVKKRVKRQQILPAQLPPLFKKPNLCKFQNKSGHNRRMTGTEAALAEEADRERALHKIQREREIKERYEAEIAALEAESPDNIPKNKSPAQDLSPTIRPLLPIHIMSDSDQEFPDNALQIPAFNSDATLHPMLSEPGPSLSQRLPSPLLRHSGQNRKLTKKAESQQ